MLRGQTELFVDYRAAGYVRKLTRGELYLLKALEIYGGNFARSFLYRGSMAIPSRYQLFRRMIEDGLIEAKIGRPATYTPSAEANAARVKAGLCR